MSEYLHQKGYIYPLGKLSDEEKYKPMTLEQAIAHAKEVAANKCNECGKEHQQLAEWLQELAAFNDETPITEEWLNEKFWFDTECEYWDFDTDVNPVEIREIRKNHLYSIFVPHFNYKINVRTRGQLRCFFSACGFGDFAQSIRMTTFAEYLKPYCDMVAKLKAYEDKTYITAEWLTKNGFELQKVQNGIDKEPQPEYIYCNDAIEISAELRDEERGIWRVWINFFDECCPTDLDICTLGQFRMFLAICGLNEIVNEFKA